MVSGDVLDVRNEVMKITVIIRTILDFWIIINDEFPVQAQITFFRPFVFIISASHFSVLRWTRGITNELAALFVIVTYALFFESASGSSVQLLTVILDELSCS